MHTEYGWFGGLRASEDLGYWIIWSSYACTTQEQLTIFCNENIRQAEGNLSFIPFHKFLVGLREDYCLWRRWLAVVYILACVKISCWKSSLLILLADNCSWLVRLSFALLFKSRISHVALEFQNKCEMYCVSYQ